MIWKTKIDFIQLGALIKSVLSPCTTLHTANFLKAKFVFASSSVTTDRFFVSVMIDFHNVVCGTNWQFYQILHVKFCTFSSLVTIRKAFERVVDPEYIPQSERNQHIFISSSSIPTRANPPPEQFTKTESRSNKDLDKP